MKGLKIGIFIFLAGNFLFFGVALAQDGEPGGQGFTIPNPLKCVTLEECVNSIINGLILLSAPIATVMVIVGAFQILTAAGDPEKFSKGRKTILYAAVGFGIILLAKGVVFIIKDVLGVGS